MAHPASLTHRQSPTVETRQNWSLMLLSSMIGAAVSLSTILAIGALVNAGIFTFVTGTTAAGVVWGIATKVSNQLTGSETTSVVLQSYSLQQSYRETIQQHIGAVLEAVVTSIRTNSPLKLQDSVYFDVCDEYPIEKKERRTYFSYSFEVTPEPGTPPRPLDESIPSLDLPTYQPSSKHTIEEKNEGLCGALWTGTLLGLAAGASASLMFLLLGRVGVVLGVVFATMLIKRFAPPKSPNKAALAEEFAKEFIKELRCQLDRLLHCAKSNNIGLDADVCATSTSGVTRTWSGRSEVKVSRARVHRRLSGRPVWSGEMADGVMRTGKWKSIADGTNE